MHDDRQRWSRREHEKKDKEIEWNHRYGPHSFVRSRMKMRACKYNWLARIHTISRSIADVDGSNRMIWNYIFDAVSFYLRSERRCMRTTINGPFVAPTPTTAARACVCIGILSEFSLFRGNLITFCWIGSVECTAHAATRLSWAGI